MPDDRFRRSAGHEEGVLTVCVDRGNRIEPLLAVAGDPVEVILRFDCQKGLWIGRGAEPGMTNGPLRPFATAIRSPTATIRSASSKGRVRRTTVSTVIVAEFIAGCTFGVVRRGAACHELAPSIVEVLR